MHWRHFPILSKASVVPFLNNFPLLSGIESPHCLIELMASHTPQLTSLVIARLVITFLSGQANQHRPGKGKRAGKIFACQKSD